MSDPYAAHRAFVRPARQAPQLWRVIALMLAFEVVFAISPDIFALFLPAKSAVSAFYEGTSAFGTLMQFFAFGVTLAGFLILLRALHGRDVFTLIGNLAIARRDLVRVGLAVGLWLLIVDLLPPWINFGELAEVRNVVTWALLIPVALLALLVQVGTEELVFRGYLQQQFACLSNSRWAWMFIPSAMFGSAHFWAGNGTADGIVWAIWATGLGLACADLTARTGSIGAAVGLHLANNAFALLVVGIQGWPATGLALFLYPYEDPALYGNGIDALFTARAFVQLSSLLLSSAVMWLAARIALRR